MDRRLRFVSMQAVWMIGALFVLGLLGVLNVQTHFVVSFIGFVLVVELTASREVTPPWRRWLRWIALIWFAGFLYVMLQWTRVSFVANPL